MAPGYKNYKRKNMKKYNLIVSFLAVIGISFLLGEYPLIVALSSFGIGLAYRFISPGENKQDERSRDVID
jgi:uncharacterized membrane protein SpoIIM required for sporulation